MTKSYRLTMVFNVLCFILAGGCLKPVGDTGISIPVSGWSEKERAIALAPVFSEESEQLVHEFDIWNDTTDTIRFQNVWKSCGCTEASLGDSVLSPDERTQLRVSVRTEGRTGEFDVVVRLPNSAGDPLAFRVKCNVYQRLKFVRETLALGEMPLTGTSTGSVIVQISGRNEEELARITKVSFDHSNATIHPESARDEIDRNNIIIRSVTLPIPVSPVATPNIQSAPLDVVTENKQGVEYKISGQVSWETRPLYVANPRRVVIRQEKAGNANIEKRQVLISAFADTPLPAVINIRCSHRAIQCREVTSEVGDSKSVEIAVDQSLFSHTLVGNVSFETLQVDQPQVIIPVISIKRRLEAIQNHE